MKILNLKIKGRNKEECQDSLCTKELKYGENKIVIFALSDGAGSAPKSKIGSNFATETFVEISIELIKEKYSSNSVITSDLVKMAYENMRQRFKKEFYPNLQDYYATFIGGIITVTDNSPQISFISVGDSVLFLLKRDADNSYKVVYKNQILKGEFTNSTIFFNSILGDYVYNIQTYIDFDVAILASDGFEGLLYREKKIDSDITRKYHEIHRWETIELETLHKLIQLFENSDVKDLRNLLIKTYTSDSFLNINDDDKSLIIIGGLTNGKSK